MEFFLNTALIVISCWFRLSQSDSKYLTVSIIYLFLKPLGLYVFSLDGVKNDTIYLLNFDRRDNDLHGLLASVGGNLSIKNKVR